MIANAHKHGHPTVYTQRDSEVIVSALIIFEVLSP